MKASKLIFSLFLFYLTGFSQTETFNLTDSAGCKQGYWKKYKENYGKNYLSEEGVYLNNRKEGLWTEYYESGKIKNKIEYKEGRPHGDVAIYHENGNLDETGVWKKNRWIGAYKKYYESGALHWQFNFNENGRRDGRQVYYDENGVIVCDASYSDGKALNPKDCFTNAPASIQKGATDYNKKEVHVVYKDSFENCYYYPNGNRKYYAQYKKGQLNGKEIYYYETEELKVQMSFKDGYRHGPFELFYESGQVAYKGEYKFGKMSGPRKCYDKSGKPVNGIFVKYHPNGKKEREVFCIDGKPEGDLKVYNQREDLEMVANFKDGKPHGLMYYTRNGKKTRIEKYNNGEFTGYGADE